MAGVFPGLRSLLAWMSDCAALSGYKGIAGAMAILLGATAGGVS
jgi:hypothetical protein